LLIITLGEGDMAHREAFQEMVFKRVLASSSEEFDHRNSAVLSCGGIYIPHRGDPKVRLMSILTTARKDEPVKLVSQSKPRNALFEVLMKENLN